ncbi:3',5'-cyclic AMP phosphodiesterase CpdA [Roseivivax halotolerans]|uniref:3',5'-cyclic AMP phosphodiesterase CpdA n=1 Tax=Roseivivax halotolerans TaxID=93684 RepID=A0A1I5YCZ8_9RHOB|nr:metallophosphoesterase [Roseivivax halotolerans]SFQ41990.1 3',5'-cyclic AMP phosphodiesterase CpdA [Roseivivax halotolerans]
MTRIVHISDLHFGRDRPELLRPLREAIDLAEPDLICVSGDLTQRARPGQFRAARKFLDLLSAPWIAVPGNHDTPLDNLFVRFARPWKRWRRYVSPELEPVWDGPDCAVVGLNTADPLAWQRGRLRPRGLSRIKGRLGEAAKAGHTAIVMMHHPPEQLEADEKQPMRGASHGLHRLSEMSADIVLCGHLHVWRARPVFQSEGILLLQVGTGLSTRGRGEPNDFNVMTLENSGLALDRYGAGARETGFTRLSSHRFEKQNGRWQEL